ncbi:hypothetical protein Pmar_PMAR009161 [Perkinsus marinus ATCC 50983]|uniref:Uncharacterized protein n=1 Tax=Perkinsus marinus (strain ATCC 50983 / TXsc) TaxID=423536 RepID=C5KBL4_PERM5|nr:hypothetical protein Pmar_PMAR009161 [Perkinsus marinus ATCC 50983]EER18134.1 hypothetical protein Pmar_PMAR009161 [Perkinsus marinus ATCC 50983]|eukprot:XP_002786338.1 hypothetical protein Pmar_PMAR009161 [Perkinsus marinus ATCC 50983]
MLGSVRAALLIIGVAATLEEEGVIDDLGRDPWVVTPMLSGGQYRLPDGAVVDGAEMPPGDLELYRNGHRLDINPEFYRCGALDQTLRELENQVDPTVLRVDATLSRHEHADLCGRAFGHLFRENPGWETTRERVGSVINEIMSAIGKGGTQEQIEELTAFLSDEESIAAGVAGGVVVTRSIILRMNTVNGAQTVPDWCRVKGKLLVYGDEKKVSKYRGSDEEGADEIAYKWATYGADALGDYQCMYELAMMDVFNRKNYPLALERLENLSKRPPVVFPWEMNPLDQFADPELEARVMDMLLENNPWTADSIGKSPDEEELQGMEKGGSAVVPAPHVTASVVGVGVAFLAYVVDCCRCGMYALSASRDHRFIGAVFQFECPFIKIPRGWPEPPTVQLTVFVLVLVFLLILLKILSGKLIRMLSRGDVPEHQHRE